MSSFKNVACSAQNLPVGGGIHPSPCASEESFWYTDASIAQIEDDKTK